MVDQSLAKNEATRAAVIVSSHRVQTGVKPNHAGALAKEMLAASGYAVDEPRVIGEGRDDVSEALDQALATGARIILISGGTGCGPTDYTPEVAMERIHVRLTGVETQVLLAGLASSSKAGLSRAVIGLTSREPDATLIVTAPSSAGGVRDTLGVVLPLVDSITRKLAGC
ncbi:MogA/MoaB family molybdenum cofactor biosynthesis protein [Corynebacterium uterequi]|uniref:Molybdopterin adenylyltransferase n=1 Tax=Corynebacterium uterequi TaxID=1072256 RepID=A0A0G3HBV8_9CORY|nr:molybdopterin-binding protein [Corynebacterium uterequi]AKK10881.1 molybdopterin adenylyltransferase [Corynebacterium uterequi]